MKCTELTAGILAYKPHLKSDLKYHIQLLPNVLFARGTAPK